MQHPHKLRAIHTHAFDFWLARGSVLGIALLQSLLVLKAGGGLLWLGPFLEIGLLVPLSVATAWAQDRVTKAELQAHWHMIARRRRLIRWLAIVLTGLVTLLNFGALIYVVDILLTTRFTQEAAANFGRSLLLAASIIWAINVFAFALWYWSIDAGGPASRGVTLRDHPDFLFPQKTLGGDFADWSPGYVDYLFLSFTNATAFSPTDTLPMTPRAKLMMMAQSAISLMTIALVAARAVNILA